MDEWTLNDLLECSVCLERLDTSSKVLPCQHTFCKKCLEEILLTHQELRCPECRVLVDAKIEELPPNVLLMRILEGMRNAGNPGPKRPGPVVHRQPGLPGVQAQVSPAQPSSGENNRPHTAPKQSPPKQAFARAVYDYISKEAGNLSFRKGDIIVLHRKVNAQWCQGEFGGKVGVFPLSYVQVINPLRNHTSTCKALYDFHMSNDEEEGCLTFHKDDVITVIRRVDENWAEGRLNDRIGIFPLTFVELNNVARALMKLSTNSQPGPSRVAPPTPTSEESTPLIPTDVNSRVSTVNSVPTSVQNNMTNAPVTTTPRTPPPPVQPTQPTLPATSNGGASDSSSTASSGASSGGSSSTTPNSSSNTSSSSSTAPSSPASPAAPRPASNPFRPATYNVSSSHPMILQTSHITTSSHVLPTSHITTQGRAPGLVSPPHVHRPVTQPDDNSAAFQQQQQQQQQQREKRHSFSVLTPSHHNGANSNRHSAEILSAEPSPAVVPAEPQLTRHGSQRHRRSGSDLSTVTHLPATYVALYPYKPQKQDELELKKGGVYLVTERCQDGWFKGTSNRTQKCGVFPGNYVTLAKPLQCNQSRAPCASPRDTATPPPEHKSSHHKTRSGGLLSARAVAAATLAPPELPPRSASPTRPAPRLVTAISTSWHGDGTNSQTSGLMSDSPVGRHAGSLLSTAVSPPPNVSVSAATPTKVSDKGNKEKKEKTSLMKRLTAMKRSKSPPSAATYSMDNPVFDDSPTVTSSPSHPVHSRSGSCPSQLIQLKPDYSPQHRLLLSASASARLKHKERPSLANANMAFSSSRQTELQVGGAAASVTSSSHRKSNSLDAGDARKPRQLVPPVRERFRCIVPYPPNSEHELELRVGDIIYVHRKREDGWYKGTQQRTGQTGLFPASFVETY